MHNIKNKHSVRVVARLCLSFLWCMVIFPAWGKVLLPQIFASKMVLQRDEPIRVWGFADPFEQVKVSFAGQSQLTKADTQGKWSAFLKPLKATSIGRTLLIEGTNKIKLDDILIGDVWLCSGQSNMEYQMRKLVKINEPANLQFGFPKDAVEKAKNTNIRIFLVNRKTLAKPDSLHQSWSIAQDSALRSFSVAGYFFAKELQENLQIPIGIICSAVSGSAIEPWLTESALRQEPYFKTTLKIANDPGKFYTTMIEPLSQFSIKGFLWYQGETNCFLNEKLSYSLKLKSLIKLWRNAWGKGDAMPFYLVQIAPYAYSAEKNDKKLDFNTLPSFWQAQAQVLKLPNTGLVVTTDLNDHITDLHPSYKWEVGRRLALLALAKTYKKPIAYSGPSFQSWKAEGNKALLKFSFSNVKAKEDLNGFELAGKDGQFYPAKASLQSGMVELVALEVKDPKFVRYNWNERPTGNFVGATGLPAMPFSTDESLFKDFTLKK